jgi:hypothetical protein
VNHDFDDLVDLTGLSPADQRRLQQVHDLLVAAGPPPELSPALERPPLQPEPAQVVPLERARRGRGRIVAVLLAAAVAVAAFGGGYLLGDRSESSTTADAVRVMSLRSAAGDAVGTLRVGEAEAGGNVPIELTISGLERQVGDRDYYELFVWREGKPGYPCGGFKMRNGTTTVRFTVPYTFRDSTQLVVTAIEPGKVRWPGKVVMQTV